VAGGGVEIKEGREKGEERREEKEERKKWSNTAG